MATEQARRDPQRRLEEVLGKEHALTLMGQLPPDEAATKTDVEGVREELRATRTDLREEMRAIEARLSERIDLTVETAEHRMIAALERSHGDLRKDMAAQTRVFVFSTLTGVVTVGGLAVAAGRFG